LHGKKDSIYEQRNKAAAEFVSIIVYKKLRGTEIYCASDEQMKQDQADTILDTNQDFLFLVKRSVAP